MQVKWSLQVKSFFKIWSIRINRKGILSINMHIIQQVTMSKYPAENSCIFIIFLYVEVYKTLFVRCISPFLIQRIFHYANKYIIGLVIRLCLYKSSPQGSGCAYINPLPKDKSYNWFVWMKFQIRLYMYKLELDSPYFRNSNKLWNWSVSKSNCTLSHRQSRPCIRTLSRGYRLQKRPVTVYLPDSFNEIGENI